MFQMKEQNKTSENELNRMEKSNILAVEFKILVIRMLHEYRETVDEFSENFNEEEI